MNVILKDNIFIDIKAKTILKARKVKVRKVFANAQSINNIKSQVF